MKTIVAPFFVLLLLMAGCNKKSVEVNETNWVVDTVCHLQENLEIIGDINSICLNDDRLTVSTVNRPSIVSYDLYGKQVSYKHRQGRAKYEYINPAIVRSDSEGNIYIWCDMSLKMIVLDKNGDPLEEITYPKAIRNFLPYKNLLCFYLSGDKDHIIEIYDRSTGEVILSAGANPSQEHLILSINETSGGMAVLGDNLLFAYADRPIIHTLDLDKFVEGDSSPIVEDVDFNVRPLDGDARDIINWDSDFLTEYLSENSVVNGVYVTQTRVLLAVVTGKYDVDQYMLIHDDSRKNKIYVFDHDLNFLYTLTKNYNYNIKDKWYASDGKNMFYLEFINNDADAMNYVLNKLKID